jgi:hypothetical protein
VRHAYCRSLKFKEIFPGGNAGASLKVHFARRLVGERQHFPRLKLEKIVSQVEGRVGFTLHHLDRP